VVARPFDVQSLQWSGDPIPVVDNVLLLEGSMVGVFSASPAGVLVYMTADQFAETRAGVDGSFGQGRADDRWRLR
jgi:hypothetical protein